VRRDIRVECLPGATAFVPALVASGLPSDSFHFDGFLPHKKGRQTRLRYLASLPHTFILYESPYRLIKCLEELEVVCGVDRVACVARELSKKFEEVKTATLDHVQFQHLVMQHIILQLNILKQILMLHIQQIIGTQVLIILAVANIGSWIERMVHLT
jgi:16S rRNA C1402 (ribose-2'-O) methylase RsmI